MHKVFYNVEESYEEERCQNQRDDLEVCRKPDWRFPVLYDCGEEEGVKGIKESIPYFKTWNKHVALFLP